MLELYRRLADGGLDVTLGRELPPSARLVVMYAPSIDLLHPRKEALDVVRRARGRYALIRSDAPVVFRLPVRPVLDVMPIPSAARKPWQQWLPPLPQRGLLRRDPGRYGRIRSVAFKGNPENLPPELRRDEWRAALAARGLSWWQDTPVRTDGSDQRWHDFTAVDAVVCMRNPAKRRDVHRKPPTRLVNAWLAGCVPLVDHEPGYVELAEDGADAFLVEDARTCLAILDRLGRSPEHVRAVERRVAARAEEFEPRAVLDRWRDALVDAVSARECRGWRSRARATKAVAAQVRGLARRR